MSTKLTNELISLIFNMGQALREKARKGANFKECSFLHLQTLYYIGEQNGVTMRDLSAYLHITPPSATSIINSLFKNGLVKRSIDKNDRRTIKLKITPIGSKLLNNSFKKVTKIMGENINILSETEKRSFISILKKISEKN